MNAQLSEDQNTITFSHMVFVAKVSPLDQGRLTGCPSCAFKPHGPLADFCQQDFSRCGPSERNDKKNVYFEREYE